MSQPEDNSPHREPGAPPDRTRRAITDDSDPGKLPSTRVIYGVATALETDPQSLQPLYEVIDPDALDDLVTSNGEDVGRSPTPSVSFRYEGCIVTFDSDGTLTLDVPERSAT